MADLSLDNLDVWRKKEKRTDMPSADSPLGASLTPGINADQAKMAGTPNQVKTASESLQSVFGASSEEKGSAPLDNASKPSEGPQTTLGAVSSSGRAYVDALRTMRPDLLQASQEEDIKKARLERESQLGQLRVQAEDMIKQAAPKIEQGVAAAGAEATGKLDVDSVLKTTFPDSATMSTTVANMTDSQKKDIVDKATKAGKTELATIAENALKQSTVNMVETLKKQDSNTWNDAALDKMAKDLGVESIASLTPDALIQKLQEKIDADVDVVRKNQDVLANPAASPAERKMASRDLIRQGAIGVRTLAEEAQDLALDLEKMDDITVGGTTYTGLKDLLANKGMSALITRAMNPSDPTNEQAMDELERMGLSDPDATYNKETGKWEKDGKEITDPKFVVQKYNKTLVDLSASATTELDSTIKTQQTAQKVGTIGDASINTEVMQALLPDWGKGLATDEQLSQLSRLTGIDKNGKKIKGVGLASLPADQAKEAIANLNLLASTGHMKYVKDLFNLSRSPSLLLENLKILPKALKSHELVDDIANLREKKKEKDISWDDVGKLAKTNHYKLTPDMQQMYTLAGVKPSDLLKKMDEDSTGLREWADMVDDKKKPFLASLFKVTDNLDIPKSKIATAITNAIKPNKDGVVAITQATIDLLSKQSLTKAQKTEVGKLKQVATDANTNKVLDNIPPVVPYAVYTPSQDWVTKFEQAKEDSYVVVDQLVKEQLDLAATSKVSITDGLREIDNQENALLASGNFYDQKRLQEERAVLERTLDKLSDENIRQQISDSLASMATAVSEDKRSAWQQFSDKVLTPHDIERGVKGIGGAVEKGASDIGKELKVKV